MKKLIYTTAIAILSIGMISCNQPQSNRAKDTKIDTTVAANTESANSRPDQAEVKDNKNINSQSQAKVKANSANSAESSSKYKTNSSKQTSSGKLEVGTVKRIQQGDISCYVDLVDEKGETHLSMYADFDLCDEEKKFLNKKVRLSYELANLNDCQSAEPCGKTRQETIISKMEIIR